VRQSSAAASSLAAWTSAAGQSTVTVFTPFNPSRKSGDPRFGLRPAEIGRGSFPAGCMGISQQLIQCERRSVVWPAAHLRFSVS
jgi:hypothetical protein